MGIAQGATLRIVGERTRMAMPETAIGLFPDVGASYFLSRCPGAIGLYLGLTGVTLDAADAIHARLADLHMHRTALDQFIKGLDALSWSDQPLGDMVDLAKSCATMPPETAPLARLQPAIDAHFSRKSSVAAIIESLQAESRADLLDWAQQTVARLLRFSPTLLCVTKQQLEIAETMNLADCLRMELGMIEQCFVQRDVVEGIRALLIDKDKQPRWQPSTLAEVTTAMVEAFFTPRWTADAHPLRDLERNFA
jgi:enoyl-CoA hydratase/carnithine racemase